MEIRVQNAPWYDGIEILITETTNGRRSVAKTVTLEEMKPGEYCEPTMSIKHKEAQQLIDELWQAGLRPTEGTGSAGSLKATERHLEDMRKIAFNKLKISS